MEDKSILGEIRKLVLEASNQCKVPNADKPVILDNLLTKLQGVLQKAEAVISGQQGMTPEERTWLQKVCDLNENTVTGDDLGKFANESNAIIQKAITRKDWSAVTSLRKVTPGLNGGEPRQAKVEARKLLKDGFPSKVSEEKRVIFPGS